LGPGLITGASDDDPSGIATFSQAGAKFGLGMLWLALFQFPLMAVVQEMCARIGLLKGNGLAATIGKKYSKRVVLPIVFLLLIANTINIGADINAMAASVKLLIPQMPLYIASIVFTIFIISAIILIPYKKYVKILRYLALSLFAYVATAIMVGGNSYEILLSSIIPHIEFSPEFAMMFVALIGTSISPYLSFWQTSQEVEEEISKGKIKEIGKGNPRTTNKEIKSMRIDTLTGIGFSHFIVWSIIITTAGSLHAHGITDIQSAEQAAKSLEPLVTSFPNAGEISKTVFALGIIGTGLLSIPVLAGSGAYALSDVFGWKEGLNKKFGQAKSFYLVMVICGVVGLSIPFLGVNPIQALVYSAVINGIVTIPILFVLMKIANDQNILKESTNGYVSNIIGWLTFGIMVISTIVMFITWGK